MKRSLFISLIAVALLGAGCLTSEPTVTGMQAQPQSLPDSFQQPSMPPTPSNLSFPGVLPQEQTKKNVRIKTSKGDIVIEIQPDQGPNAASNFIYLVNQKFYDGLTFHRRESWVLQGGDPLGVGTGGPGYRFEDDPVAKPGEHPLIGEGPTPQHVTYKRGIVAMANSGPDTNGSQFFVIIQDMPLEPNYSVFGRVIEGMDVVDQMQRGDIMTSVTIE